MKKNLLLLAVSFMLFIGPGKAQDKKTEKKKESILKELSAGACSCIDSINVANQTKAEVAAGINKCIDKITGAYQLTLKLLSIDTATTVVKDGKKQINISMNLDSGSAEYTSAYYTIERYLMNNCKAIKDKISSNDKKGNKSFSDNADAMDWYSKGIDESKKENYKKAIGYFERALAIDQEFAFAWDNLGISYRKLGDLDKALEAYRRSLEIDSTGLMPLQNIAIVYQYKKDYPSAIKAYERLAALDDKNPEIYYGIGQIYALNMADYEKGLDNMCRAYNLYIEQKSPYRTDAEKIINLIYGEMKKQGKEDRFNAILKENHISPDKK